LVLENVAQMMPRELFFDEGTPILERLSNWGLELDQRLSFALSWNAENLYDARPAINDADLLTGLIKCNASVVQQFGINPDSWASAVVKGSRGPRRHPSAPPEKILPDLSLCGVLDRALFLDKQNVLNGGEGRTLETGYFLRALAGLSLRYGDDFDLRPFSVDALIVAFGGDRKQPLGAIPRLKGFLQKLYDATPTAEDFQYLLALENDKLVFRVSSVVGDYVQAADSNLLVPQRAVLSCLANFGLFSAEEIEELESLINSRTATEADLQSFFVRHPHFLRRWDHRGIYPHVYLTREAEGPLIPDFILTHKETQEAAVLDLKRAWLGSGLVRRQRNRERFSSLVMEARSQLLTYKDWFDDRANRQKLKTILGMEIYRPRLMVVIGRASEFQDEIERQRLRDRTPDVEVVTYDDILRFAKQRMVLFK
jgi:hypothetical protein